MGSNRVELSSEQSSRRSSPVPSEGHNSDFSNLQFDQLQPAPGFGRLGGPLPEAGWAQPAVAANQLPTCEAGMWSPQNPNGTPLQGWDSDKGDLFAFAHFNSMCEVCEQVIRCSMTLEKVPCTSPAFLAARDRGRFGDSVEGLICCSRPVRERCYALEVLATLVQDEDWTLRGVPGRQAEYLDCLRFYLNQQFLKLVEQGKVLQCFDETGRALWICFCTGLVSFKAESIFCVLQRNSHDSIEMSSSWHYTCFVTPQELQETRQPWNALEPIITPPEQATFFENQLDLQCWLSGQGENIQLHPQIWDGLEALLPFFPKSLVKFNVTLEMQMQAVISALQRAVKMLQRNPFMAVPQFYGLSSKESGALQLLLPMQLDPDSDTTHMALALDISKTRRGGHMYRGIGMMPLRQAYANARIIMPVWQPWLSSCAFTCEPPSLSSGNLEKRQSRSAIEQSRPSLACEPKPRTILSAPSSFNFDESFSRTCSAPSENWLCISQPPAISQRGGSLSAQTTPDSSSPISPSASCPHGGTQCMYAETSPSTSSVPVNSIGPYPHRQVSSPPNHPPMGNVRRSYMGMDPYGERKSVIGTGVTFPSYSDNLVQCSSGASSSRFPSFEETTVPNGAFDHSILQGLSLIDKDRLNTSESQHMTFSQGGDSSKQTSGYQAMTDLGGYTWGLSSVGHSLGSSIVTDLNGASMGSSTDLAMGFVAPSTMPADYMAQSRQAIGSSSNLDMTRLGSVGLFQAHTGVDLTALLTDLEGHRHDEYVEFTAADDACPKVNVSQLPPRFVADYLSGDHPGFEQHAELHTSKVFGRYGMVARSLVRQNKNHSGKWFAIVEFTYWTDEAVRLQLIQGGQIRSPDFYGQEDVVFRRHKDKHKKQFCTQGGMILPGASCRPLWKYTGTDTRAGKPLFKGPCSQCGKESTVPFKPVVNGQPPRCRNCLPLQQTIPVAELMQAQQSQMYHITCS